MKFYIALWASKFYLFLKKIVGKEKSDRAGLLAARIYPQILTRINKPKITIAVTGTNGKSTISYLLAEFFKKEGKKVNYNDWGANMRAGHIRCLIDSVNIFNKPNKDVAILETDELTSNLTLSEIQPNYIIVTNICRDSIRRNSYPEVIFSKINDAINKVPNAKIILNADDPISSFAGEKNEKIFVSIDKLDQPEPYKNISPDFNVCPKCNTLVEYEYRHYRHLGRFKCPNCGLTSFKGDYVVSSIKENSIIVNGTEYKTLSRNLFNAYNETMVLALLKSLNYSEEKIQEFFQTAHVPESRENLEIVKGINIYSQMAKGQNSSALSIVLENLSKLDSKKQIILLLDEVYGNLDASETITWLYDSDFELLNSLNLEKVVVTGPRYLDYIVRLKFAGVPDDKIEISEDYKEAYKKVNLDKNSDIYVLYEVDRRPMSREVVEALKSRIESEVSNDGN